MGFFSSISQGFAFIREAFSMAFTKRKLLAPSVYLVCATIVYYVVWIAILIAADVALDSTAGYALEGAMVFGNFVIFYFFMGMTVNMIDVHLKGGEPSVGEAFADALKNVVAIVTLAGISTIVELVSKMARRRGRGIAGLVGALLASIIEAVWTVVSFLLLPIIIIEDCSVGAALRRAKQIHRDNLLLIGIGAVGVRFALNLVSLVGFVLIFAVVYLAFTVLSGTAALVLAILGGGTLLALTAALQVFVRMAYYTCLYLWAVEVERVGGEARAPAPLAAAMGVAGA